MVCGYEGVVDRSWLYCTIVTEQQSFFVTAALLGMGTALLTYESPLSPAPRPPRGIDDRSGQTPERHTTTTTRRPPRLTTMMIDDPPPHGGSEKTGRSAAVSVVEEEITCTVGFDVRRFLLCGSFRETYAHVPGNCVRGYAVR